MRKLIGYIRNLADGLGPPPGSVEVHATADVDDAELAVNTHGLGTLTRVHEAGSGSATLANAAGKFGWEMELAPGQISQEVIPSDPQLEYRWRFPDESSQVGMGFHSDIGRLGWAAGGDCLVWNAIAGGDDPSPASWAAGDPSVTWNLGNGSIASFNSGMTVTLRPFIGFVGGALFSVENGNIVCPTAATGGTAAPVNASGQERWDLLEAVVNTDKTSDEYGKQTLEVTPGTPGAGIPTSPAPTATERRMPLHGLGVVAGGTAYSKAYDLRKWKGEPTTPIITPPVTTAYNTYASLPAGSQVIAWGQANVASLLNTMLASRELVLPSGTAFTGMAFWTGEVLSGDLRSEVTRLIVKLTSQGRDASGNVVAGTDYIVQPYTTGHALAFKQHASPFGYIQTCTLLWPIAVIPAFDIVSNVSAASRSWAKLRFNLTFSFNEPPAYTGAEFTIYRQSLLVNVWPVG